MRTRRIQHQSAAPDRFVEEPVLALAPAAEIGSYKSSDRSSLPVARVDAARLVRVLRQLEVIAKQQEPRIAFKTKGRIVFVELAEIVAVQAEGNYVSLQRRPNPYLLREALSSMAEKLKPLRLYSHPSLGSREHFRRGGDPAFAYGRVQAAHKRWEGIPGNADI